jgi:hypothetical protein
LKKKILFKIQHSSIELTDTKLGNSGRKATVGEVIRLAIQTVKNCAE